MNLHLTPIRYADAAAFVALHHRHHKAPPGQVFSIAVADGDEIVGVAMVGRPVARHYDDGLYGACARAAFALGYRRLITYTEAGETGASLRAAGWRIIAERPRRPGWSTPSRRRDNPGRPGIPRTLWEAPA